MDLLRYIIIILMPIMSELLASFIFPTKIVGESHQGAFADTKYEQPGDRNTPSVV